MKQYIIGKLAEITGTTTDTLRYYEKMKLLKASTRSKAGYRIYDEEVIQTIRFIRGAKALGFTLVEVRQLLTLSTSDQASCAQIVDKTEAKIAEAETRILELKEIKKILKELVEQCPGGNASVDICPILDHIKLKVRK